MQSESASSEDIIGYNQAYLSVELFRFSIKIDGKDYKLPALQEAFINNGFTISGSSADTIKPSYIENAVLSNETTSFEIQLINPTQKELPFGECPVGRLSYDFSGEAEIYIADSVLLNEVTQSMLADKYGEADNVEKYNDFTLVTYGSKSKTGNYAQYLFKFNKNGKIVYFDMVNHYIPKTEY